MPRPLGQAEQLDPADKRQIETLQVRLRALEPLERLMSEIPGGHKHVYSRSARGQWMVAVRFWVGEAMEPSIVKLYQKVMANLERMPPGVRPPLIQRKGIDDVPILNLTLWSEAMDDAALRDLGLAFAAALPMIYFLLVMELRDFRIPLIIVAPIPIPLTLLGIVPVPPDHRPGPGGRLRGNPDRSHPFQGMAVSLLFGVLVVTLLRL